MIRSPTIAVLSLVAQTITIFVNSLAYFAVPQHHIPTVYFTTLMLNVIYHAVDYFNSNNCRRNLRIMREKAGLSQLEIWGSALIVFLGFQLPTILLQTKTFMGTYNPEWEIPTIGGRYWSWDKIVGALVMVLVTDGCFFLTHRYLHEKLPRIHLLHHCCVYSSQTTNLFFHPLDFALEFSAPVLVIWALCKFAWPAQESSLWMFALTLGIVQTWYVLGHDEWLKLSHVHHHQTVGTGYFIYFNYFYEDREKESVRRLIRGDGEIS